MQAISRFVRTTILGGVLFLTPIVAIWFILSRGGPLAGRPQRGLAALMGDKNWKRTTITAVLEVLWGAPRGGPMGSSPGGGGRGGSCANLKCP